MHHHGRMATVLLILPSATYRAADFLDAAATVQANVVTASEGSQALATEMGDRFLPIDFNRPDWSSLEIVGLAQRLPLDAVIAVDDAGVDIAARAAAALGLRHNPVAAVAATRDKALLRTALTDAGLRQPRFRIVAPDGDVATAAAAVGFPCVVKPVGLSASRGVIRVDDPHDAIAAGARVRAIVALAGPECDPRLVVEEYLPGDEYALEGLLSGGDLDVLAIFDKPDPLTGPYFEETMLVAPARTSPEGRERIVTAASEALKALGLREGPVHVELRVDGDAVTVLEAAARSVGGLCGRALRFGALGATLETVLLRHALGFPTAATDPQAPATGVMMLPIPRRGVLEEVRGKDEALAVPGIRGLEITIALGEELVPLPEGDRYLGFLFARAGTPDGVEAALRTAHARLDVVIR